MRTDSVRAHIEGIADDRYRSYETEFAGLAPVTDEDLFRRFLFVLLSVNMNWRHNVSLYNSLKDLSWLDEPWTVEKVFLAERCGLEKIRSAQIVDFGSTFFAAPEWWWKTEEESWHRYRERVVEAAPGLGITKVSFLMEMVYPESPCVCLDRHMLRKVFGHTAAERPGDARYRMLEKVWSSICYATGRKPGISRMACWDSLLGYSSHHFWTDCLAT